MACSSYIAFPRSIKWVFTLLFSFLWAPKYIECGTQRVYVPHVLKFCWFQWIYQYTRQATWRITSLRWSSRYSGWFQNKPHAQKIRTSANFTFQYSCSILQHCVLCITVPLASCLWLLLYIFSLRWKHNQVTEVCTAENVVTLFFYGLPCQHTLIRKHPATKFYPMQPNWRTVL